VDCHAGNTCWVSLHLSFQTCELAYPKLLQAVIAYGPKINLMDAAEPQRFMELLTQRTTLSAGVVKMYRKAKRQ
jgi:hypothetical protein